MEITLEFSGIARILSGARQTTLPLDASTTYQDLVRMLAGRYPQLLGQVIDPEGISLYPSNMFNRNGQHMVTPAQMHEQPQAGDRLILMSILAGG